MNHFIALYLNINSATYFDSSGVENIRKEILKIIAHKNIAINVYRIQACKSVMDRYFCIGFINFILKGKTSQL